MMHRITGFIKENKLNLLLLSISSILSMIAVYYAYNYIKQPSESIVYHGKNDEFLLSFYNTKGRKITETRGTLKLMTDPFTIYTNYPNQESASFSINSNGCREGYVNDTGEKLAIVLGGSAAFGSGLPDNRMTFASRINQSSQKYNVKNCGVIGFLSGQELSQMVHYLDDFSPSLYIVFDAWNDINIPYVYAESWPVTGGPIGFNRAYLEIEDRLADYHQVLIRGKDAHIEQIPTVHNPLDEPEYFQKIMDTYISNIDKMNAFATGRGAYLLMVFQPDLGNKKILSGEEQEIIKKWDEAYKYLERKIPQRYDQLISRAKRFCKEQNIEFIDINEESAFSKNPQTLFWDVVHPNELGHQIIGDIISKKLTDKF